MTLANLLALSKAADEEDAEITAVLGPPTREVTAADLRAGVWEPHCAAFLAALLNHGDKLLAVAKAAAECVQAESWSNGWLSPHLVIKQKALSEALELLDGKASEAGRVVEGEDGS